jgi:hypothetical protein
VRSKLFLGAVVAGLMVLATPVAAHAESVSASCSDSSIFGTHIMRADAYYVTSGANHIWTDIGFSIGGDHTGGKSNVNAWLYVNGSNVWSYHSPDNLQHDTHYGAGVGVTVNAAANEYMAFQGIFDVAGPDPKCTDSTPSV